MSGMRVSAFHRRRFVALRLDLQRLVIGGERRSLHVATRAAFDVEANLHTTESDDQCVTVGRLVVSKALSSPERYYLAETPCSTLRVTAEGDIVLYGKATGRDWSGQRLSVDAEAEIISLGPTVDDSGRTHAFELSAPKCGSCSCPQMVHSMDTERARLALGRDCD